MSEIDNNPEILDDVLRLGVGFADNDRSWILDALESQAPHLARWEPSKVDVEIYVQDRDGKKQQVTLRADLPGYPPLIARAAYRQLDRAVAEAKHELVRQIDDAKGKREPNDNRHLRDTLNEHL